MKFYMMLCSLALCSLSLHAAPDGKRGSDAMIVGHVIDRNTGEHLPYITLTVKGTTLGTTTDASGHYLLNGLPAGEQTIVVQSIGYATAERSVVIRPNTTHELNFELEEAAV